METNFQLPESWPGDGLLNALLASENVDLSNLQDFNTNISSPESDFSPSSYSSSSPFSSPVSSPDFHINIPNSTGPTMDDYFKNNNNNRKYVSSNEESLESIIQNIMASDVNFGYHADPSGQLLKKRKFSDLETSITPTCIITSIIQQITQGKKLFLSREQLLQLSSDDFDKYMQTLSSYHKLTSEDNEKLKKQRRVIKNREYSQNSRQKKKQKMEELEAKIQSLENENEKLKSENQSLKQKIWKIIGAYQRSKNNTFDNNNNSYTHDTLLPSPSQPKSNSSSIFSINSPVNSSMKATGACLFIVLLSFGLFLSFTSTEQQKFGVRGDFASRTGRIILQSEDTNTYWWNSFISHISGTISALEDQPTLSQPMNRRSRLVTTFTTNIDQSYESTSEIDTDFTWDATHVCDFDLNEHFSQKHFANNQTLTV